MNPNHSKWRPIKNISRLRPIKNTLVCVFNLISGIFTVPVPGIYHFDFSTLKENTANYLGIYLRVNDANVGYAYTWQSATGSQDVVSLSASLRLAAGDTVNLYNPAIRGELLGGDSSPSFTHFVGWLVEEDLM